MSLRWKLRVATRRKATKRFGSRHARQSFLLNVTAKAVEKSAAFVLHIPMQKRNGIKHVNLIDHIKNEKPFGTV